MRYAHPIDIVHEKKMNGKHMNITNAQEHNGRMFKHLDTPKL